MSDLIINWLAFTPIFAVPLALAALGLIINERAGVLNLGAEGIMLCGALAGVAVFMELGSNLLIAMIGAMLAGAVISALFAFMVVVLRANQVVTGITLVFFCSGLTGLIGTSWTDKAVRGFTGMDLGWLSTLPGVGKIVFSQDPMVYLTVLIAIAVWYALYRTNLGLRLRSVGENPQAADAAGLNIEAYRFFAVVAGGMLIGLAGGYLSLAAAKIWVVDMTYGRGWIAIALVIFARWMPGRAILGALIFGGIEALIPRILATGAAVPQYFLQMTPYVATLIVLIYAAASSRVRSEAPAGLGEPYVREDRH